jgi:3-hydroxyacyl-[acyl-carrier-protein] dehydratase
VTGRDLILDPAGIDTDHIVADITEIRRINPQRFEMEQLTAVCHVDVERRICVGYKDITNDEFWVRGHMPGMPLMPGVVMCEAAAQLSSFMAVRYDLLGSKMVGFGGLENVRFRDPVFPGDRLVLVSQLVKVRRERMIVARFQGFVRASMVVEGTIKGVPLPVTVSEGKLVWDTDES